MQPLQVLLLAAMVLLSPVAAAQDAKGVRPPNLVVLLSDDAGYADFGFQPDCDEDARKLTPRIDSIAARGARFTDAYVSGAVCSPSRAGVLTGRYQQRFGHERNIPVGYMLGGMDLAERTMGDRLRALGHRTAYVGKWHLGYPDEYHPNQRGFDLFHGLLQGSRPYGPLKREAPHQVLQVNGKPQPEAGYVTDRLAAASAAWIREHADEPFLLFVSFTAPHGPLEPLGADLESVPEGIKERRRKNLGLLVGLDRAVGTVLDAIDEAGVADRTLVVFTNDNGGQTETGASNGPLRGRKGMVHEGGVRVPMAVRWPGRVAPGSVVQDPVSQLDLLPTFVSAAGGAVEPEWRLDGVDLGPRLRGEVAALPERPLFWRTNGNKGPVALRDGIWKLVHERGTAGALPTLFRLDTDRGEQRDLAEKEPERMAAMMARIAAWEQELVEPRW